LKTWPGETIFVIACPKRVLGSAPLWSMSVFSRTTRVACAAGRYR
jgi:hypothetical protein